jgi:hypothetical protein
MGPVIRGCPNQVGQCPAPSGSIPTPRFSRWLPLGNAAAATVTSCNPNALQQWGSLDPSSRGDTRCDADQSAIDDILALRQRFWRIRSASPLSSAKRSRRRARSPTVEVALPDDRESDWVATGNAFPFIWPISSLLRLQNQRLTRAGAEGGPLNGRRGRRILTRRGRFGVRPEPDFLHNSRPRSREPHRESTRSDAQNTGGNREADHDWPSCPRSVCGPLCGGGLLLKLALSAKALGGYHRTATALISESDAIPATHIRFVERHRSRHHGKPKPCQRPRPAPAMR